MISNKFENFSAMLGHSEGRGRATPILTKIKFGYFFKILFAWSSL